MRSQIVQEEEETPQVVQDDKDFRQLDGILSNNIRNSLSLDSRPSLSKSLMTPDPIYLRLRPLSNVLGDCVTAPEATSVTDMQIL